MRRIKLLLTLSEISTYAVAQPMKEVTHLILAAIQLQ